MKYNYNFTGHKNKYTLNYTWYIRVNNFGIMPMLRNRCLSIF